MKRPLALASVLLLFTMTCGVNDNAREDDSNKKVIGIAASIVRRPDGLSAEIEWTHGPVNTWNYFGGKGCNHPDYRLRRLESSNKWKIYPVDKIPPELFRQKNISVVLTYRQVEETSWGYRLMSISKASRFDAHGRFIFNNWVFSSIIIIPLIVLRVIWAIDDRRKSNRLFVTLNELNAISPLPKYDKDTVAFSIQDIIRADLKTWRKFIRTDQTLIICFVNQLLNDSAYLEEIRAKIKTKCNLCDNKGWYWPDYYFEGPDPNCTQCGGSGKLGETEYYFDNFTGGEQIDHPCNCHGRWKKEQRDYKCLCHSCEIGCLLNFSNFTPYGIPPHLL